MPRARGPLESIPAAEPDPPAEDESLDLLYRRHAAWLRAGIRRRFGQAAAAAVDDLVQETYVRAAGMPRDTVIRNPRALLMRIASRLVFDQARMRRRDARVPAVVSQADADAEAQVLLKQVILSLPPHLRDVFLMSRFGGLTYEEIAGRTGLAVKTVEWRMSRALAHCATRLNR